jgi:hypothetical protein
MNRVFVSDMQLKLAALLMESKNLVPFASDAQCEVLFQKLETFAQMLLAKRHSTLSFRLAKTEQCRVIILETSLNPVMFL